MSKIETYNQILQKEHLKGGNIYKEERDIAETFSLIQLLKSGEYNSKLFGILFSIRDTPVDVI